MANAWLETAAEGIRAQANDIALPSKVGCASRPKLRSATCALFDRAIQATPWRREWLSSPKSARWMDSSR